MNEKSITPNPPANFTPTRQPQTPLRPFRFWCQQVLPLVYDDSLSYYELLCKVVDYLNKAMEDVENMDTDMTNMYTAYNQLQSYVNDYFNSLDVQTEINNKLDNMASDGLLSDLIEPFIPTLVTNWLKENITPTSPAIDASLSISGAGADAKVTGDTFANTFHTGTKPIGSPSGEYSGEITSFKQLDPHTPYLIWKNAFSILDDVSDDIKNIVNSSNFSFAYVQACTLFPFNDKTYSSSGYTTNIFIYFYGSNYGLSLCTYTGASGILSFNHWIKKPDTTLRLSGNAADAKATGDTFANTFHTGTKPIGGPSGEYSGEITSFKQLDPHTPYLIWKNAFSIFDDVTDDIKNIVNSSNFSFAYVQACTLFPFNDKTYSSSGYVIYIFIYFYGTKYGLSLCSYTRDSGILSFEHWIKLPDTTLSISGLSADAKTTGDRLNAIEDELEQLNSDYQNKNDYLISPNGNRYITQVNDNGEIIAIPVIPNKALFIGNSLLLGFIEFGMAASDKNHDYYHYITSLNNSGEYIKISGTTFEGATTENIATNWINDTLSTVLTKDLNLIIIQLGDNVNTPEKREVFNTTCEQLIKFIRNKCPNSRVCWVAAWYNEINIETIQNACKNTGITFIDITDITGSNSIGSIYTLDSSTPTTYEVDSFDVLENNKITIHFTVDNSQYEATVNYDSYTSNAGVSVTITGKEKVITSSGVASHPGDSGMLKIANRIAYTLGMIDNEGDIK